MDEGGIPRRKPMRLREYDYSRAGVYFVTICTDERKHLLGCIELETLSLSPVGQIVRKQWLQLPQRFSALQLDEFVIMPNHFHGIVAILEAVDLRTPARCSPSLSQIIGAFKSLVVREVWKDATIGWDRSAQIWQRSFYDHVVRDEKELLRIREYVVGNVTQWALDRYHSP